jgi:D-glycero-D-manno-heptose 1,7-bisphosphate phosphatase
VNTRPAAFLDRDGLLNDLVGDPVSGLPESPLDPADVQLLPGVGGALARLADAGFALVCVSNQPAAAKGRVSVERLLAVHERVEEALGREGVRLDGSRLCLHSPAGVVPALSGGCDCRKPAPGMLLNAAAALGLDLASSWMIGDTDADVLAGRAAGCRTALVEHPGSVHKRFGEEGVDLRSPDLDRAVTQILGRTGPGEKNAGP